MSALFERDGDTFVPSELTRGGWSPAAQHGGPPSALLARATEAVATSQPMMVVRMTIDLIREVPLAPLTVSTSVIRDGRRVQLVAAEMAADGVVVGRSTALKIRIGDVPVPHEDDRMPSLPPPLECRLFDWMELDPAWGNWPRFHVHGVEIRTVDDSFARPGPGRSWFRLRHPVVAGEEPTPFVRTAALADMGNGNSQRLDGKRWLYVNPDITLYLHDVPSSEWLGMHSTAHQHRTGIGLAVTHLCDERGSIGLVAQGQLIEPRSTT